MSLDVNFEWIIARFDTNCHDSVDADIHVNAGFDLESFDQAMNGLAQATLHSLYLF